MATEKQTIYQRMVAVMRDVDPIAKDRKNVQQGFAFRGIDDVYQALQAVLAKHGVLALPHVVAERTEERKSAKGHALIYRVLTVDYHFYGEDGDTLPVPVRVIGEGMDSGDKAANKAMSVADKYCLLQAFKIPTCEPKDPDAESHDVQPKAAPASAAQPTPQAAAQKAAPDKDRKPGPGEFRFGRNKCTPLRGAPLDDLEKYAAIIRKQIEDPEKTRYRGWNEKHLTEVEDAIADIQPSFASDDDQPPPHDDDDIPF